MGRDSKSVILDRRSQLAVIMKSEPDYQLQWLWYWNTFSKSEKSFQADKTVIYQRWIIESQRNIDEAKAEIIQELQAAKKRAIDGFDVKAEIAAIKLKAQILGILNKQGEINIENAQIIDNQLNIDLSNLSLKELKSLL